MEQKTIGTHVKVKFLSMGNATLDGKVDTGAELSSMHVDSFNIAGDMVAMTCKLISSSMFRLPLTRMVTIRNSDGQTEERPVVTVQISINNDNRMNVEFSLNDRSNNADQILIGQNILKTGNFIVDPNLKETEEFDIVIGKNPMNIAPVPGEMPGETKCCAKTQIKEYLNKISVLLNDLGDSEEKNDTSEIEIPVVAPVPTPPDAGTAEATNG